MADHFEIYKEGNPPDKDTHWLWPLYGAGLENLGQNEKPIEVPLPSYGPDQLLVRHDACGLCFSDIKVIRLGQDHPRIYRDMQKEPVVLGHEVVMTVVGVGEKLKSQYQPGDRFILQADIFIDGVGYAYGYEIQGGLSQYNVIDQRVLNGDHGNYLIPIRKETGYAEAALVEPWACVIAAYYLTYRTQIQDGGTAWFIGPDKGEFFLSAGFNAGHHPARIKLTNMDGTFGDWLREQAQALGIEVIEVDQVPQVDGEATVEDQCDDIILLDPTAELIEKVSPFITYHGILAFSAHQSFDRKANLDIGRVHYNRWLFLGGSDTDIAAIYAKSPANSALKKGGAALFVGAGGPMGRMHVQHAIEADDYPAVIVCSDVSNLRLDDLEETFGDEARAKGITWVCVNPMEKDAYDQAMQPYFKNGFDDIVMLAPIPAVIAASVPLLANGGVMNVFAGVARGTTAEIDLNDMTARGTHIIGHSASVIEDMLTMLNQVESGKLSTNRSVAAIGSLSAARDGMQALIDATYPGKVVIFPNIKELPLTSLSDLKELLPEVYAKLGRGQTWTKEAEAELLSSMAREEGA
jgi:D-arabinose 1-dehydrogenase-like Zn-dependent alcohol dehydrogenase